MNIRPLTDHYTATYFTGITSQRNTATVTLAANGLQVELENYCFFWPYEGCRVTEDGFHGEPVRLEHNQRPGAALAIEDAGFLDALTQHAPSLTARRWWDLRFSGWADTLRLMVAVLILSGSIYYLGTGVFAELGARFAPRSLEDRLGVTTVQMLAPLERRCADNTNTDRLRRVEARVFAAAPRDYPFEVLYVPLGMPNAFATPGGKIIVSKELIELVGSPEEYAGVLAHEVQHILHRDSMRAMARAYGASAMLSMLSMDSASNPFLAARTGDIMSLSFSRDAEASADAGAVALLEKARIPTDGLTRFLNRLLEKEGGSGALVKYLSTHPPTAERIATLRRLTNNRTAAATPLLSEEDWKKAKKACQ